MRRLERFFRFRELGTDLRTEVIAGLTTFMTMSYVIFVHPGILSDAMGKELFPEILFATCVSSAIATLIMGLLANYPFALAPGMGLNAYFTYTVVLGLGVRWEVALGAVLISGILFTILTLVRIREMIITAVPAGLKGGIAAGIGVFLSFMGLQKAGIVVANPATFVGLGDLQDAQTLLAFLGLLLTAALMAWRIRGAILLGILVTALLGMCVRVAPFPEKFLGLPSWPATTFGAAILNIPEALGLGIFTIVFVFLFIDMFDTIGTLVGVGQKAGFLDAQGQLPRANRALLADSIGTVVGAVFGTSTVTTYVESASGVYEGGRSGFANVITALLFLLALFITPLAGAIPSFAIAPALIIVGVMMMSVLSGMNWDDPTEAIPAFLVTISIPLTFSIANGLAIGFITYPVIKLLGGRGKEVHWLVYLLAALFIARYVFLSTSG